MLDSGIQLISRTHLVLVFIVFWLNYGFDSVQCCSDLFSNHIGTTTNDMVIKEGDPMEVECSLLTSSMDLGNGTKVNINSEMLLFKYNGTRIQNSKVQIVDNFTIKYKVKRTSMKENGYYMCYVDLGFIDVKPRAICATFITIAHPPSAGDDFNVQCSGFDLKNFTCRWDLQSYNLATNYQLSLIVHDNFNYSTCPNRLSRDSCTFTTRDSAPYLISDKRLKLRLDVDNKFGSISKSYDIDHYSNVILDSVSSLNFVSVGAQNVFITWDPPNSIADDPYLEDIAEYLLKVYPVQSDGVTSDSNTLLTSDSQLSSQMMSDDVKMVAVKGVRQFNFSDLIPYTNYQFEIRCRLITSAGEGKWSKELTKRIQTRADVPYYYPLLTPGGFEVIRESNSKADLKVYFLKIDQMHFNGPNFTIIVRLNVIHLNARVPVTVIRDHPFLHPNIPLTPPKRINTANPHDDLPSEAPTVSARISFNSKSVNTVEDRESQSSIVVDRRLFYTKNLTDHDSSSFTIYDFDTSHDLLVSMFSVNALGASHAFSKLYIPVAIRNQTHPGVDQFYAINWGSNKYTLYWTVSSKETASHFTIYWCEVTDTPQCDRQMNNVDVFKDKRQIDLTINYDKVQFGIATTDYLNGFSSGIKWAQCIESATSTQTINRFKRFNLVSVGSKSVLVDWSLDCPALYQFIHHYQVHYCRTDQPCSKTLTMIDIAKSTSECRIVDLEPSTGYNFTIFALTTSGERLESSTISIETKVDIVALVVMVSVVLGAIMLVLAVLYILLIFALKKRKNEQKLKKAVDSNWIPKMPSRLKGDANILLNPLPPETRNEYENKEYMNSELNNYLNTRLNLSGKYEEQLRSAECKDNVIILSTISGNNELNGIIPCSSSSSSVSPSTSSSNSTSSSSSTTGESDEGLGLASCPLGKDRDGVRRKGLIKSFSSVSSISSSRKIRSRKLSDGGTCDSEDSGYSTKLSDKNVYYRGNSFTIDGIIKSIDENSPYIAVPDKRASNISINNIINSSLKTNGSLTNLDTIVTVNRSLSDSDLSLDDQSANPGDNHPSLSLRDDYLPSHDDYHPDHHSPGHNQNDIEDVNTISNGYVYA